MGKERALTDLQSSLTQIGDHSAMQSNIRRNAIDLDHLSRQAFEDRELMRELLQLYLRQSLKLIDIMEQAGPDESRDLAHTLKGSSRSIGAFGVAREADTLESVLETGGDASQVFSRLRLEAMGAAADIRHFLEGRA
jgi:HPt (histidine-containing phosphotransfer) domain-containing protein